MQNRLPVLGKVPKNRRRVFRKFQRHFLCKIGSQFRRQFQQNRDSIFGSISEKWGGSFGPAKLSPISGAAIKNLIRNDFAWPVLGPQKGPIFGHQKLGPGLIFGHFFGRILGHENRPVLGRQSGQFRVQILDPFWELQVLVLCSSLSANMDQFWALNWVHLWGSGSFFWATKL